MIERKLKKTGYIRHGMIVFNNDPSVFSITSLMKTDHLSNFPVDSTFFPYNNKLTWMRR